MNAIEYLAQKLREDGYDGLACPEFECGCRLDDLAPCEVLSARCKPGHLCEPTDEARADGATWAIMAGKLEDDHGE